MWLTVDLSPSLVLSHTAFRVAFSSTGVWPCMCWLLGLAWGTDPQGSGVQM